LRLKGEIKRVWQSKKKPAVPSILQSRILELRQMVEDRERIREKTFEMFEWWLTNWEFQMPKFNGITSKTVNSLENCRHKLKTSNQELEEFQIAEKTSEIENHHSQQTQTEPWQKRVQLKKNCVELQQKLLKLNNLLLICKQTR
jgi:hypothetical protein